MSRDAHGCDRIKAVLLRSEGWSITAITQALNKWLDQKDFIYKKIKGVPHTADGAKQTEFVKHYESLTVSLPEVQVVFS